VQKNRFLELSRNQIWNRDGHVQYMLIFKLESTLFSGVGFKESIPCENQFRRGINSREGGGESRIDSLETIPEPVFVNLLTQQVLNGQIGWPKSFEFQELFSQGKQRLRKLIFFLNVHICTKF
jgi:hypothetical protein